ncbi:helix-turn-helix transcriptional regulator [Streptomyces sp. NBC_01275]|uniref:helix-turn-helix transcriptional regulator n=1 Tax=Streptomyces sp. NBC_01275 TaxID=2903807 RepID=UPI002259B235|nr:helix-turn-helix transcriptional regulator [Streptomyces sp. NBC_01275]MCX4762885.1 helix-turn-helix transcriptional regulator [Streptomyces sp. NBC_01275]
MTAGAVSVLGLSELEERLYRHFLRNPGATAGDVHLLLDAPLQRIERALERLLSLAVVVEGAEGGYLPATPELVVDSLTDMRLKQLHEEMRAVTQARHLVASLRAEQELAPTEAPVVEKIENLDTIRSRIDALAFFAREEILSAEPYTALTHENIQHARPLDLRCIRRGVRIRNVVVSKALGDPVTLGYLRELTSLGAEIRVVDEIAARILVYDRNTALTPVDPADGSRGALVSQEAGLVANIVALFEKIWAGATELTSFCGESAEDRLPEVEQRVLEAMCRGTNDEIGARDLGVSVRTYRRYVASILNSLDAASRPHAVFLARERGWI